MIKKNRPQVANPLAGMALDDIVRNMTTADVPVKEEKPEGEVVNETASDEDAQVKSPRRRRGNMKAFEENLAKYKGLNEQGFAIWLPKDVKKKLEIIRLNANRTIPLRALASAIIMTNIQENEEKMNSL